MLVEGLRRNGGGALDEGRDDLAPALVRKADHRDLRYGRVQRKAALDLHRRHVLAARDDHVVDPAGDKQGAIGVEVAAVAGEVPAVTQRLRVGIGPLPVTLEGLVACEMRNNLAFFVWLRDVAR